MQKYMDILTEINNYSKYFNNEKDLIDRFHQYSSNNQDKFFDRKNMNGHITASGMVISNSKILMIKHPYLNIDLLPGGHIEAREVPLEAAIREIREEAGYEVDRNDLMFDLGFPFDIDIHAIPPNKEKEEGSHIHIDFCYVFMYEPAKVDIRHKNVPELQYSLSPANVIKDIRINKILKKLKEVTFHEMLSNK